MRCLSCGGDLFEPVDSNYIYSTNSFKNIFPELKCVRCKNCKLVQLEINDWKGAEAKLDEYYRDQYRSDNKNILNENDNSREWYAKRGRAIAKEASKWFELDDTICVYEFGGGYGINLEEIKGVFKNAILMTYEKNELVMESLIKVGAEIVPLQDAKRIDFFVMAHVLEHLTNPVEILNDVYPALNERGIVYIEVPDNTIINSRFCEPHVSFWNQESFRNFYNINFYNQYELIDIYTTGAPLAKTFLNRKWFTDLKCLIGKTKCFRMLEAWELSKASMGRETATMDFSEKTRDGIFLKMILKKK